MDIKMELIEWECKSFLCIKYKNHMIRHHLTLSGMARIRVAAFLIPLITSIPFIPEFLVYAQETQSASGSAQGILPGDIPTLFSFNATKNENGNVSGNFECFALMPDGKTMYVNGTVTGLTFTTNQSSVVLTGPAIVTGFGAGTGAFKAIATPTIIDQDDGNTSSGNGTLILTTDINGDGVQASASDGSEGPFNEKIIKGSIRLNP
jgi:hypothetical protein